MAVRGVADRRSRSSVPGVAFIATNGGQINISGLGQTDIEPTIAGCPNLSLQTAGVYREDFPEGIVERFGASRLLYVSAFPLMEPLLDEVVAHTMRTWRDASAFPLMEPLLEVERPRSMHVSEAARARCWAGLPRASCSQSCRELQILIALFQRVSLIALFQRVSLEAGNRAT